MHVVGHRGAGRAARTIRSVAAVALISGALAPLASAGTSEAAVCHRVAAPSGDDDAAGTVRDPLRTAQALVNALRPGLTGCLRKGTYDESGELVIRRGGAGGAPLVLRSYPGERATLRPEGMLHVRRRATDVSIRLLDIDGTRNAGDVTVWIQGSRATLADVEVTNRGTGTSCILVGAVRPVPDVRILRSRIHDCGASSRFDHGVYAASAVRPVITDNVIWKAAAWGIQVYPNTQGAWIERNILDDNGGGIILGGAGELASSNNVVQRNVVSNTGHFPAIDEYWEVAVGTGNLVAGNCIWPETATGPGRPVGFVAVGNVTAEPAYADRASRDYRLLPGSPCTALFMPVPSG